ncbi:hypothetical protein N0V88_004189 [Collariella sp. IMI 366227]|nr:hypothetical protein N0V88_004189 [Collariella sp. IMI 366227]
MSFQTPSGPAAKRRRIDAANATLRKPFRSPLIRQPSNLGSENLSDSPSTTRGPTSGAGVIGNTATPATPAPSRNHRPIPAASSPLSTTPGLTAISTTPLPKKSYFQPYHTAKSTPITSSQLTTTPSRPRPKPKVAPQILNLNLSNVPQTKDYPDKLLNLIQAAQKQTTTHLRTLESRLDLVRQARRIQDQSSAKHTPAIREDAEENGSVNGQAKGEGKGKAERKEVDAELRALVKRWKGASRLAAEEVFEVVKGRVEGMGGEDGDGDTDERFEEVREGDEDEEEGEVEDNGEEEFTMLMMLKSLNIDLEILGYDPVEDKWRD